MRHFAEHFETRLKEFHSFGPEEAPRGGFDTRVTTPARAEEVCALLHELVERQAKPKDIMKPIRAAMEAGVLARPTWGEFCAEFGAGRLKSKASFTLYTGPSYSYQGEDFRLLVERFRELH